MFWGLNLKPNRKYTQTTSKSFHISQAALDADSAQSGANQIYISCESQKFLICTLRKDVCEQVMLDLNFAEGDEICFQSLGSGNVSLSGYLIEDDSMEDLMNGDEEEESEIEMEEDLRNALNKKAKAKKSVTENTSKDKGKTVGDEEDDDEDEDDSDYNGEAVLEGLKESDDDAEADESDDDEEDEEDDSDEEDESEDEVPQPKAKQQKLDKSQKQQNGVATKESAPAAEKKDKKDKKAKKENQQQQKQQVKGERSLTGGVKIEDIRVGNGPEAKTGKRAQVYYEGRLKSNNKVFDSLKQGAGFKFGLGRGEVIKGWDVGVIGMKVGGKRRIICPPHMAYGARGSPPSIPPNSTLVFEVELKSVN